MTKTTLDKQKQKELDLIISALKQLHKKSINHKDEILESAKCGCFHCKTFFKPQLIDTWVDNGNTALCPHCNIDSVIPNADVLNVTDDVLNLMYVKYFNY